MIQPLFTVMLVLAATTACEDLPDLSADAMSLVTETIDIDGLQFVLEVHAWRDFMPICEPGGTPLMVICRIVSKQDRKKLPRNRVIPDAIWVNHDGEIWKSHLSDEDDEDDPDNYAITRSGPKWPTLDFVDVVARFAMPGTSETVYIKSSHINIECTS